MKLKSIIWVGAIAAILMASASCKPRIKGEANSVLLPEGAFSGQHISGQCLVTAYDDHGKKYFTNQSHDIYERPETIVVTGQEPGGTISWTLSGKRYEIVRELKASGPNDYVLCNRQIAAAVLSLHLASTGVLRDVRGVELAPVRLGGKWYHPLKVASEGMNSDQITLFRNPDKRRIGRVTVMDSTSGKTFTVIGYDMRLFRNEGVSIPGKIDVFNTGKDGECKSIVLHIDYHRLEMNYLRSNDIRPEIVDAKK